jgi:hypothetical protein
MWCPVQRKQEKEDGKKDERKMLITKGKKNILKEGERQAKWLYKEKIWKYLLALARKKFFQAETGGGIQYLNILSDSWKRSLGKQSQNGKIKNKGKCGVSISILLEFGELIQRFRTKK